MQTPIKASLFLLPDFLLHTTYVLPFYPLPFGQSLLTFFLSPGGESGSSPIAYFNQPSHIAQRGEELADAVLLRGHWLRNF